MDGGADPWMRLMPEVLAHLHAVTFSPNLSPFEMVSLPAKMSNPLSGRFRRGEIAFAEELMVGILREADREQVVQVAKKHGISEQTIYTWPQRFSGMNADEVKHLRPLEQENAHLKKLLAERDLEIEVKKEVATKMVSAPARRQQATFVSQGVCVVLSGPFSALLRVAHGPS